MCSFPSSSWIEPIRLDCYSKMDSAGRMKTNYLNKRFEKKPQTNEFRNEMTLLWKRNLEPFSTLEWTLLDPSTLWALSCPLLSKYLKVNIHLTSPSLLVVKHKTPSVGLRQIYWLSIAITEIDLNSQSGRAVGQSGPREKMFVLWRLTWWCVFWENNFDIDV